MRRARQGAAGGTCSDSSGAYAIPAALALHALRSYRLFQARAEAAVVSWRVTTA